MNANRLLTGRSLLALLAPLALCALFLAAAPAALAETLFLKDIDDVPLAEGLVEDRSAALVFNKPAGRIVEAEAAGTLPLEEVRGFYGTTLPQLGWQAGGRDSFTRGDEQLTLSYSREGDRLVVHFTLQPQ